MPAPPKLKGRANLPRDRSVPEKIAAARLKGKLTPTQLVQFFTAHQRDKTSGEALAKQFEITAADSLLKHYAIPVIYQDLATHQVHGVYEVPKGTDINGSPQYLGEHLNALAAKKQAIEKRHTENEEKNFDFN